jgi:hypothetical protein
MPKMRLTPSFSSAATRSSDPFAICSLSFESQAEA